MTTRASAGQAGSLAQPELIRSLATWPADARAKVGRVPSERVSSGGASEGARPAAARSGSVMVDC